MFWKGVCVCFPSMYRLSIFLPTLQYHITKCRARSWFGANPEHDKSQPIWHITHTTLHNNASQHRTMTSMDQRRLRCIGITSYYMYLMSLHSCTAKLQADLKVFTEYYLHANKQYPTRKQQHDPIQQHQRYFLVCGSGNEQLGRSVTNFSKILPHT